MKVLVPLRTGTGQNDRENWRARARRVKAERHAVAWLLKPHLPLAGPVTVTMTRISPGQGLDAHDNLRSSLKAPVDQVAEWLGRDDRDPSITWAYDQRRGKPGEWLVGIEVSASAAENVGHACRVDGGRDDGSDLGVEVIFGSLASELPRALPNSNDPDPAVARGDCGWEQRVAENVVERQHGFSVVRLAKPSKGSR